MRSTTVHQFLPRQKTKNSLFRFQKGRPKVTGCRLAVAAKKYTNRLIPVEPTGMLELQTDI
jgi:hypothetical protein